MRTNVVSTLNSGVDWAFGSGLDWPSARLTRNPLRMTKNAAARARRTMELLTVKSLSVQPAERTHPDAGCSFGIDGVLSRTCCPPTFRERTTFPLASFASPPNRLSSAPLAPSAVPHSGVDASSLEQRLQVRQ